jgi:hypothetical protein
LQSTAEFIKHGCRGETPGSEVINQRKKQAEKLGLISDNPQRNSQSDVEVAVARPQQVDARSELAIEEEVAPMQEISRSLWEDRMAASQDNCVRTNGEYSNGDFSFFSYGK